MKYSLRSLMIVVLVAPPLLAGAYYFVRYLIDNERAMMLACAIGLVLLLVTVQALLSDPNHHS